MSGNQLYRGLNVRFEARARRLAGFGFKYRQVAPGIAAFCRRDTIGREQNLAAAEVLNASNRVYRDTLAHTLRRF